MILSKYPDIDTIKSHPAHRSILLNNNISKSSDLPYSKSNIFSSNFMLKDPKDLRYYKSKNNTPLHLLSYSPK